MATAMLPSLPRSVFLPKSYEGAGHCHQGVGARRRPLNNSPSSSSPLPLIRPTASFLAASDKVPTPALGNGDENRLSYRRGPSRVEDAALPLRDVGGSKSHSTVAHDSSSRLPRLSHQRLEIHSESKVRAFAQEKQSRHASSPGVEQQVPSFTNARPLPLQSQGFPIHFASMELSSSSLISPSNFVNTSDDSLGKGVRATGVAFMSLHQPPSLSPAGSDIKDKGRSVPLPLNNSARLLSPPSKQWRQQSSPMSSEASTMYPCKVQGCFRYAKIRGLCLTHKRTESQQEHGEVYMGTRLAFTARPLTAPQSVNNHSESEESQLLEEEELKDRLFMAKTAVPTSSKKCKVESCQSLAKTKGLCKKHGGGIRCGMGSCTNSAKKGGYCIRHGGGRCKVEGCKSGERKRGMCYFHNRILLDEATSPPMGRSPGTGEDES